MAPNPPARMNSVRTSEPAAAGAGSVVCVLVAALGPLPLISPIAECCLLLSSTCCLLPMALSVPYPLLPVTSVSFVSSVVKGPVRQSDSTLLSKCCRFAVEPTSTRQHRIDSRLSRCDSGSVEAKWQH